ncbi:CPBP family intramembrane glutamic endopeptidase [Sphingomonas sp.]|uniref:CPBP family intramembrane glutamic endopeptidase n=1 Tax=Sphingomonas sp. TaxID=28214 RepID=UPI0035C7E1B8
MTPSASAAVALVAGTAVAAAVVLVMPAVAERLIPASSSAATAETLFNAAVFGCLLAAGALGGGLFAVNAFTLGTRPLAMVAAGTLVGVSGVLLAAAVAAALGTLQVGTGTASAGGVLLWGAAVVLVQAGAEEVYFRGWLQPVAVRGWGAASGVAAASLAFTMLHAVGGARAPLSFVNLFLGGLLFGMIALLGRGLAGAVAAHGSWNGAEQLLLGLDPNPGVGGFGAAMNFDLVGGDEGLNASLVMTLVLLALLVPAVLLLRRRRAA